MQKEGDRDALNGESVNEGSNKGEANGYAL